MKNVLMCSSMISLLIMVMAFSGKDDLTPTKKRTTLPIGDTSSFVPNAANGWGILSSYLNQDTPDSVDFELILKQNNSISWLSEQFIGTISNKSFIPKKNQKLTYYLLPDNVWSVRVATNGQCYLYQQKGQPLPPSSLPGAPFVMPLKVTYKNN